MALLQQYFAQVITTRFFFFVSFLNDTAILNLDELKWRAEITSLITEKKYSSILKDNYVPLLPIILWLHFD